MLPCFCGWKGTLLSKKGYKAIMLHDMKDSFRARTWPDTSTVFCPCIVCKAVTLTCDSSTFTKTQTPFWLDKLLISKKLSVRQRFNQFCAFWFNDDWQLTMLQSRFQSFQAWTSLYFIWGITIIRDESTSRKYHPAVYITSRKTMPVPKRWLES
jgi:hypothetical protein